MDGCSAKALESGAAGRHSREKRMWVNDLVSDLLEEKFTSMKHDSEPTKSAHVWRQSNSFLHYTTRSSRREKVEEENVLQEIPFSPAKRLDEETPQPAMERC